MSRDDTEGVGFPFDDGGCFGCSASNPDGLQLRFHPGDKEVRGTYSVPDRFHGAPGIAHGGIIATILDEYSCAAAVFLGGKRVVTGELSVRYEGPCPVEKPLQIRAWISDESHPKYWVVDAEIRSGSERVVRSSGKFFPQDVAQPVP